jgi:hypothetical protein
VDNILTFDVATSGNFEGICLVCTWTANDGFQYWVSRETDQILDQNDEVIDVQDGKICNRMSKDDLCAVVHYLYEHYLAGYTIYGWGTTGYDLRLMAKESGLPLVKTIAINHVDLQNNLLYQAGRLIPLAMVAKWVGSPYNPDYSKTVPEVWVRGDHRQVASHTKSGVEVLRKLLEQRPAELGYVDTNGKVTTLPATYDTLGSYYQRLVNVPPFALKPGFDNVNWIRERG